MKANARFERQASVARLNRRNSHIAHIRRCIYYVTDPAAFIGECCSVALSFGAALVPGGGIGAEAEEALRRSEERYRSLAEAAHDMIFIVDRDDTIRYVNTFGASRFGLQPHEMIGKKRGEFFPSGESKRQKESLDRVFTSGEPYYREVITTFPGGQIWLDSWLTPLKDADGNVTAALGISRDTTTRKRAEQLLERLNEELERRVAERTAQLEVAVREQEAFSYSVSHEMRTWLNHVRGFGQLLFDYYGERLGDEGREFLGHIIDSSAKIDQVIDDLLNLSSTARRELCFEMVELGPTAEEVVDGLRILYPERRVEFICTCAGAVRGDPGLLRLLLENLLKNAWKFTAERDAALIEFGVTRDNGRSVFFVRDNGIGFDMAFAEKIFQPFQRLSPEEYDGSGIGLATVRRIVHRHGGRIWAVGEPGEGASFYFTL